MAAGSDRGAATGDLRDVPNSASCESGRKEFNSMSVAELEAVLNDPQPAISKRYRKRVLRRIEWLKRRPDRSLCRPAVFSRSSWLASVGGFWPLLLQQCAVTFENPSSRAVSREGALVVRAQEKERRKRKCATGSGEAVRKRPAFTTMRESPCKIRVAIDLSLGAHMTDKEKVKCRKQIQRCYSLNRRSPAPVQLYLTGLAASFKDSPSMHGFEKWDVHRCEGDHVSCFGKDSVVYLSSESDNELQELEEGKAYVIGGLVDHNRNKGLCHRLAQEQGVRHARLPIGHCLVMKTRQVLTIDQVFAILLLRASRGQPWTEALLEVIPPRKGARARPHVSLEEEPLQECLPTG